MCVCLQDMVSEAGLSSLLQPIQVWIPSYVHCGSGFDVHFEFEVKVRYSVLLSHLVGVVVWTGVKEHAQGSKLPEVGSGGRAVEHWTVSRGVGGSIPSATVSKCWQFFGQKPVVPFIYFIYYLFILNIFTDLFILHLF